MSVTGSNNATTESSTRRSKPLRATVNCDMGEGFSIYTLGEDEALMKLIHLANVACGFHASDFNIMNETIKLAKQRSVLVGAHPSLPDRQGFGRREMAMDPDELESCFTYQIGALSGFLKKHGVKMNHVKPHGSVYGMTARSPELAAAAIRAVQTFNDGDLAVVGLLGTCHETAAKEAGIRFIPEWFADLDYTDEGKLIITKFRRFIFLDVNLKLTQQLLENTNTYCWSISARLRESRTALSEI